METGELPRALAITVVNWGVEQDCGMSATNVENIECA
jgi:hypothetical protein